VFAYHIIILIFMIIILIVDIVGLEFDVLITVTLETHMRE